MSCFAHALGLEEIFDEAQHARLPIDSSGQDELIELRLQTTFPVLCTTSESRNVVACFDLMKIGSVSWLLGQGLIWLRGECIILSLLLAGPKNGLEGGKYEADRGKRRRWLFAPFIRYIVSALLHPRELEMGRVEAHSNLED